MAEIDKYLKIAKKVVLKPEDHSIEEKIKQVATKIYKADGIILEKKAKQKLKFIEAGGWQHLPICIAKTQYSFTDTPEAIHTYDHFTITVDDLIVNTGAGFIVAVCGEMMRMPGLPEKPAALQIDMIKGRISGLS
jgi:formate--tetrahydrofolate ligase